MLSLRSTAVLSIIFCGHLFAQPEGFYLVDGDASPPVIDSTGCYVVKVGKSATINWDSFSINENETFRFEQEDSESSVINFVTGDSQSAILGNLQSNGKLYLTHPNEIFIGPAGNLSGPNIFLVSEQGKLEVNGTLTANISSGKGGKIHVLGKEVEIQGSAVIDASGSAGEGEVLIGGSFQGKDRSIPHSERTVVHQGAQISVIAKALALPKI
jgi:filamentous hemagglutinin family protein